MYVWPYADGPGVDKDKGHQSETQVNLKEGMYKQY